LTTSQAATTASLELALGDLRATATTRARLDTFDRCLRLLVLDRLLLP
jgi:hypothetical protein